jgi:hypothetical protein
MLWLNRISCSLCLLLHHMVHIQQSLKQHSAPHLAVAAARPGAAVAPHAALDLPAGLPLSGATAAGTRARGGGSCRSSSCHCSNSCILAGVLRPAALEELRWQVLGLVLQAAVAAAIAAGKAACLKSARSMGVADAPFACLNYIRTPCLPVCKQLHFSQTPCRVS